MPVKIPVTVWNFAPSSLFSITKIDERFKSNRVSNRFCKVRTNCVRRIRAVLRKVVCTLTN